MTERAAYRIIDANFNRAREALRLIEDYCRFCLDNQALTARAKGLRHQLSQVVRRMPTDRLLACRDVASDTGAGLAVPDQISRTGLSDCLAAGCKRLTEALRVMAEACQPLDRDAACQIESLRFQAYALEQDVALVALPTLRFSQVALYVLVTGTLPGDILSVTAKSASGGADCVQLRSKGLPDRQLLALAEQFVRLCHDLGALAIINDRLDVALACGADGVHLGNQDLPVQKVRALQHRPLIIGLTTHNLDQIQAARILAPTYVSVGPVFRSKTKPGLNPAGLDYVRQATAALKGTGIYHVAIGGIDPDNVQQVLRAGAAAIAVGAAVTQAPDPAQACRRLKDQIRRHQDPGPT